MRNIVSRGDKGQALCEACHRRVSVTYRYGSTKFDNGAEADNVMIGYCDTCGSPLLIAGQSVYRNREALENHKAKRTKVRFPLELTDFMSLELNRAGLSVTDIELYLRALFQTIYGNAERYGPQLAQLKDAALEQPQTEAVNLTVSEHLAVLLAEIKQSANLDNTSEVVRRLVVLADADDELLEQVRQQLRRQALLSV